MNVPWTLLWTLLAVISAGIGVYFALRVRSRSRRTLSDDPGMVVRKKGDQYKQRRSGMYVPVTFPQEHQVVGIDEVSAASAHNLSLNAGMISSSSTTLDRAERTDRLIAIVALICAIINSVAAVISVVK